MREIFLEGLARWVALSGRWGKTVLVACVLSAGVSLFYTSENLSINSDTAGLVSEDVPFQVHWEELREIFPEFVDLLLIAVEAPTGEQSEDAAELIAEKLREDSALFPHVVVPGVGPFFRRNGLLYLEPEALAELVDRLADAQPALAKLSGDPSLRGVYEIIALAVEARRSGEEVPESFDELARKLAGLAESVVAGNPAELAWSSELMGGDGEPSMRMILTQPRLDFDSVFPGEAPIEHVRELEAALKASGLIGEDVQVRLTGDVMLTFDELGAVQDGIGLAGLVSLIALSLILGFGLRSFRLIIAIYSTLFVGLAWAGAFAAVSVGELNMISSACAVLFIGLGIDYAIHFCLRHREAAQAGVGNEAALIKAARGTGGAMTLCAISSAIGFLSFLPTEYKGFADLGIISAGGMGIALFSSFTMLPAMLSLLGAGEGLKGKSRSGLIPQSLLENGHAKVAVGIIALAIAGLVLAKDATFDFSTLSLKDPDSESVLTLKVLVEEGFVTDYSSFILAKDLGEAERLSEALGRLSEVDVAVTPLDLVPADQETKLEIIEDAYDFMWPALNPVGAAEPPTADEKLRLSQDLMAEIDDLQGQGLGLPSLKRLSATLGRLLALPERDAALAQFEHGVLASFDRAISRLGEALSAQPVTFTDLPPDLASLDMSADGKVKVSVLPSQDVTDYEALKRFAGSISAIAPKATGRPIAEVAAGKIVVSSFKLASLIALCLVSVLMLAIFRDVGDVLMVLIPIAMAVSLTTATTVLIDIPFNFANVIVLPLLLGFGVDSGVHLVARRREGGSLGKVMGSSTPRAVILSALTTTASFGSLSLSPHFGTASMGMLLTISMLYTVICSVVVLPALMSWRESWATRLSER